MAQLQTGRYIAVTDTESGQVRGFIHNDVYTFKGIPYGRAERFGAATKPEAWEGVRSSLTYGPVAPLLQPVTTVDDESEFVFDHDWGYTSEDCLVLNVWTPGLDDGKQRPVMFWIHGGGYTAGSSQELPSYHGENLAKSGDVVVVSINHRLNVLGFLDLSAYGEAYATSANNSILDMQLALEWVRDNIAGFGGDPENVTIFGQSGGGAKVNTLMAMPSAQGLFHKAVNQSGAFRTELPTRQVTGRIAEETLSQLGLTAETVDSIRTVPFAELSAASSRALQVVETELREAGQQVGGFGLGWGPSLDGTVLPYQTNSAEALALSRDIPLLIGTVKNEFMPSLRVGLSEAAEPEIMAYVESVHGQRGREFIEAVRAAYPDTDRPSDLIDVDLLFRPGAVRQANAKADLPDGAPVYMYLFTWQSPVLNGKYKAIHCIELPFVFDNVDRAENMTGGGPEAHALAERVSRAWINFARSGDPNHPGLPTWEPYTSEGGATMMLDNDPIIRYHPDRQLLEFNARQSGR